jgi:single-stranded-DNA-specific exonuclease
VTSTRWKLKEYNPESATLLARELGVSSLLASVLAARGLGDLDKARKYLTATLSSLPDPLTIAGMPQAVSVLLRCIKEGQTIWVYTDFDADGVTSAAVLSLFFAELGADCRTWLPRRDREGYGLHIEPLREMAAQGGGVVLTADCGITAVEPARVARELGLTLVITDHHTPAETLPDADAVVNPKLDGSTYPDSMLAGVGVAWNLTAALRRALREDGYFADRAEPDVRRLLDLVALGTVADVVPLRDVNRILVQAGLQEMNLNRRPGIEALAQAAGIDGELKAGQISFQLAPRINAAGRMEGPQEAVELLVSPNIAQARPLASLLDKLNRERRSEEAQVLKAALDSVIEHRYHIDRWSLVVEGEGYHPGVVGIVASRMVERFYRPSIVLSVDGDTARGSARSIHGCDLVDALGDCAHLLVKYGGHRAAAGMTIRTEDIGEFRELFEAAIRKRLTEDELAPLTEIDVEAVPGDISLETASEFSRLEPMGFGNPNPVLLVRGLTVREHKRMGQKGEHLRLVLDCDGVSIEAVGWSMAERLSFATPGSLVEVAAALKTREWRGRRSAQLVLKDLRLM